MFSFKDPESLILLSASIQSDCQEILAMGFEGDSEAIRQYLNRSKWALSEAARLIRVNKAGA
jgi:hypothetical protein